MNKVIFRILAVILLSIALVFPISPVLAENGARLFEVHCAGCHPNGGNIIRRGRTLQMRDLKKFRMDSVEAIGLIVTNGKGVMSAFKEKLTPAEIEEVARYVLQRAGVNWAK
ncbi:c-type cytochrome [Pannus brasiliensis CCIBt3594]|uniref:C-type cytochrome n=1 Tax=Pannus brasiliensis CCIBt3594 TaxID=1427578 RepID=A0AAW9QR60_9CHRO